MQCLECGHIKSRVTNSRYVDTGQEQFIRRRRECRNCRHRWTTREDIDVGDTARLLGKTPDAGTTPCA